MIFSSIPLPLWLFYNSSLCLSLICDCWLLIKIELKSIGKIVTILSTTILSISFCPLPLCPVTNIICDVKSWTLYYVFTYNYAIIIILFLRCVTGWKTTSLKNKWSLSSLWVTSLPLWSVLGQASENTCLTKKPFANRLFQGDTQILNISAYLRQFRFFRVFNS